MDLIINDHIIIEPIENIILELKREANWRVFKDIQTKSNYLRVTCPFHKDGEENKPSCSIFTDYESDSVLPGTYHCFTCGAKGTLYQLVASVLGITNEQAKDWLVEKYGNVYDTSILKFNTFALKDEQQYKQEYLDESILDQYKYYHPYLAKRKISFEVAKKFTVGYNTYKDTITFPVWDEKGHLVMITERSVKSKYFYIPEAVEKPVYLLNFVLKEHARSVIICEGQIDALVAYTYGYPAVALFGTGTDLQYNILKNSGIRQFILCFDGDSAGRKGANRFIKNMPLDIGIIDIKMPVGKDVADCTKAEFYEILQKNGINM